MTGVQDYFTTIANNCSDSNLYMIRVWYCFVLCYYHYHTPMSNAIEKFRRSAGKFSKRGKLGTDI